MEIGVGGFLAFLVLLVLAFFVGMFVAYLIYRKNIKKITEAQLAIMNGQGGARPAADVVKSVYDILTK